LSSVNRVFDQQHYEHLNRARGEVASRLLTELKPTLGLRTAIDVGCGLGYFSRFLASFGLDVTGIDGREQNASEGRRRYPGIRFITANVESPDFEKIGTFDLVLCFGLLYHLENPFQAVRNLHTLTGRVLLIESMCAPGSSPSMEFLDEYHGEDQALDYVAFYPTEACLVKMLFRAGFPFVYGLANPPDHEDFREGRRHRSRIMLVACNEEIAGRGLMPFNEPKRPWDIWSIPLKPWRRQLGQISGFARDSWTRLQHLARRIGRESQPQ
jgi:SAM-dependent methyltransferase